MIKKKHVAPALVELRHELKTDANNQPLPDQREGLPLSGLFLGAHDRQDLSILPPAMPGQLPHWYAGKRNSTSSGAPDAPPLRRKILGTRAGSAQFRQGRRQRKLKNLCTENVHDGFFGIYFINSELAPICAAFSREPAFRLRLTPPGSPTPPVSAGRASGAARWVQTIRELTTDFTRGKSLWITHYPVPGELRPPEEKKARLRVTATPGYPD